jgi:hypothetical protein
MKQLYLFIFLIPFAGYSQNVGINATGAAPDSSALLDVSAANKGMLIPRLGLAGRFDGATILSPATSLVVYNTFSGNGLEPGFYYNAGTPQVPDWRQLLPNPANKTLDMDGQTITNVPAPVAGSDAVNKNYVDALVAAGAGGGAGAVTPPQGVSLQSSSAMTFSAAVQYCNNLNEGGHSDWRLPTVGEIAYFAGSSSSDTLFLWTKSITQGKDFATNQNYISYRLSDGKWRDGGVNRFYFPTRSISGSTTIHGIGYQNVATFTALSPNNLFVITSLRWTGFGGGCCSPQFFSNFRLRYNFPDGSFYYSEVRQTGSSSTTTFTDLQTIPILNESAAYISIDLEVEPVTAGVATRTAGLSVSGYEITLNQADGNTLHCRCVR